jgi:hypothetical protein
MKKQFIVIGVVVLLHLIILITVFKGFAAYGGVEIYYTVYKKDYDFKLIETEILYGKIGVCEKSEFSKDIKEYGREGFLELIKAVIIDVDNERYRY